MGIKSHGQFVYLAAGGNEVGLWDIQEQSCKQVFRAIEREETEVKKTELPSALRLRHQSRGSRQFGEQLLNAPPRAKEGIRSVMAIGEGGVITGGSDKYIRVWDGIDPKNSFPMCGPPPQNPYSDSEVRFSRRLRLLRLIVVGGVRWIRFSVQSTF